VQGFEVRVARAVNGALGRKGKVFPDRYHRRDLGTPTEVRNVLSYVLNNARKHVRHIGHVAYVDATTSGEGFDGWSEPVERLLQARGRREAVDPGEVLGMALARRMETARAHLAVRGTWSGATEVTVRAF
jgi:hypothetical protein